MLSQKLYIAVTKLFFKISPFTPRYECSLSPSGDLIYGSCTLISIACHQGIFLVTIKLHSLEEGRKAWPNHA